MKSCTKCGESKELNAFGWINKTSRHHSWCKECVADRQHPKDAEPGEPKCAVIDCPRRQARGGFCARHYKLNHRNGNPTLQKRASSTTGAGVLERKRFVRQYKLEHGCTDCGYKEHYAALSFDHLPGTVKVRDIKSGQQLGWEALLEEIAKCEVVCFNCHMIRTWKRVQGR